MEAQMQDTLEAGAMTVRTVIRDAKQCRAALTLAVTDAIKAAVPKAAIGNVALTVVTLSTLEGVFSAGFGQSSPASAGCE